MSFEEFLAWDDGTDTRYEFVAGEPVAMAPPTQRHAVIADNVGAAIRRHLDPATGCKAAQGAGIAIERGHGRDFYIADVIMTCEEASDSPYFEAPRLIVEVLSPSNSRIDKERRVPDHCRLPSLEEIWLVESRYRWAMVWQKVGGEWIGHIPYRGDQRFKSRLLGAEVALDDLYRGAGLDETAEDEASG